MTVDGADLQEADVSGITIQHQVGSKFNILTLWDLASANSASSCHFFARWNRVLSLTEMSTLYNNGLYLNYPFTVPAPNKSSKLVFDGDSLTAVKVYPLDLLQMYGRDHPYANFGVGGQQLPEMLARVSATDAAYDATCTKNILVFWGGTNDIHTGNRLAADVYNDIVTYCIGRRAVGYKVVVCTIIPRGDNSTGQETQRLALNSLITANWNTFADGLVDGASDTAFSNPSDRINFVDDTIHLTAKGYSYYAESVVKPVVDTLI